MGRPVFQRWFSSASAPRRSTPSSNSRRLIPDCCRWESAARKKPSAARYSARASFPFQPHGTKRLEIEYHQSIPVENLKSYFAIPLRPDAYQSQVARHLRINFELHSAHAISNFQAAAKAFPLQLDENTPHSVKGHFEGENVNLTEDFVATYDLDPAGADTLQVLTYRNPVSGQPSPTETAPVRSTNEPGFFEAEALLGYGKSASPNRGWRCSGGSPKTLIILFDTSLSMQWEKLERSYQALESLLRTLRPADRFNLLLFNNQVQIVPACSGRCRSRECAARSGFRALQQAARRHRSAESAAGRACSSVRRPAGGNPYLDIAERRRRDSRADPERQTRQLGMRKAGSVCRRRSVRALTFSAWATMPICRCCACWPARTACWSTCFRPSLPSSS